MSDKLFCYGCCYSAANEDFPGKPSGERPCCFCTRNKEREEWVNKAKENSPEWFENDTPNPFTGYWYDNSKAVRFPMDCYQSLDMLEQIKEDRKKNKINENAANSILKAIADVLHGESIPDWTKDYKIVGQVMQLLQDKGSYRDAYGRLTIAVAGMQKEVGKLRQWIDDLQSGMYVNCVYCGHRYGPDPGTPVAMAEVLKEHIAQCPGHPLSEARKENERLKVEQDDLTQSIIDRDYALESIGWLLSGCEPTDESMYEKFPVIKKVKDFVDRAVELNGGLATLNQLAKKVHALAVEKGWWEGERSVSEQIANFHDEISEAWQEYRNGNHPTFTYYNPGSEKPEGFPIEMADLIIRVLDTCAAYNIDIEAAIRLKHEFNKTREWRHGGKLA